MDRYEFKEAMKRGLGRAYIALKTEGKERFRDIVQWGCLHSLSINMQSDGSLEEYIYSLVRCYDDPESFATPLINAFLPLPFDEDSELFHQYVLLLGQFAKGGSKRAEGALVSRYEEYLELMSRPDFESKYATAYEEECLCKMASMLLDVSLERYLVRVATDFGRLCERKGDGYPPFHWLYCHFHYSMPRGVLRPLADVHTREVDAFLLNLYALLSDDVELCGNEDGSISLKKVERAFKDSILAGLEDRLIEADPNVFEKDSRAEEDEDDVDAAEILSRDRDELDLENDEDYEDDDEDDEDTDGVEYRLQTLRNKVNRPFDELIYGGGDLKKESNFPALVECLQHYDEDVSRHAKFIFCGLKHKTARDYALKRLAVEGPDWWTLTLLIRRYREQDKDVILSMLSRMEADFEDDWHWHAVVQEIVDSKAARGVDLPTEILRAAYELSLCRHCRYKLLQMLYERKAVPVSLQIECYYDGNEDVRTFAEEHNFVKKDY